MKKRIFSFLLFMMVMLLTVSVLGSCGSGKGTETKRTDDKGSQTVPATNPNTDPTTDEPVIGLVISASNPGTIIFKQGATGKEMELVLAIRDVIHNVTGVNPQMKSDADVPTPVGTEIVVGNTNREITASAMAAANDGLEEGHTAFVLFGNLNALAFYYTSPEALEVGFDMLIDDLTCQAEDGVINFGTSFSSVTSFCIADYYEQLEQDKRDTYLAEYEGRWLEAEKALSADALKTFQDYYDMCGDGIVTWLANLWDPEIGGFYYANSARDYEGFLPDVETLEGVLQVLELTGMVDYYGGVANALPSGMQEKIVSFVKGLQDEDGYFYHPQWGKNINSSRRGRDLNWSTKVLNMFGETPTYKTPIDQLAGDEEELGLHSERFSVTLTRMLSESGNQNESIPDYLKSEDAFMAYVKGLKIGTDSHSAGHTLSSQGAQIQAAGLLDVLLDYLSSIQREDNGLWEEGINYSTISGMYKISGLYVRGGRKMQYTDKIVDSCIKCITSEETPSVIIYVMNPWGSLSRLIDTMRSENKKNPGTYDLDALTAQIRANAAELITVTTDKLKLFRHEDGSFSYYIGCSAAITQGTYVSLGMDEGDVNASIKPFNGIVTYMCNCFDIERVDFFNFTHFERFMEIVNAAKAPEKISLTTDKPITFDDAEEGTLPLRVSSTISSTATDISYAGTITDPDNAGNKILKLVTEPNSITKGIFDSANKLESYQCYVFETKMNLVSADDGRMLQILVGTNANLSFELCFDTLGKYYTIYDSATTADAKHSNSLGIKLEIGKWYTLRVEYYPGDKDTAAAKVYIDGHCYAISHNWYNGDSDPNAVPVVLAPQSTTVNLMKVANAEFRMDDVKAYFEEKTFTSTDLEAFPEPDGADSPVSVLNTFDTLTGVGTIASKYPDKRSLAADPANDKNNVLKMDSTGRTSDTSGGSVTIQIADQATETTEKTYSFKFRVSSIGDNKYSNFFTSTGNAVLYQLYTVTDGKKLSMLNVKTYCAGEADPKAANNMNATVTGFYFVFVSDTNNNNADECTEILALDTWYEIKLVFTMDETPSIALSINGVEKKTTDVFFLNGGSVQYAPKGSVAFTVTALKRTRSVIYMDDLAYVETPNQSE